MSKDLWASETPAKRLKRWIKDRVRLKFELEDGGYVLGALQGVSLEGYSILLESQHELPGGGRQDEFVPGLLWGNEVKYIHEAPDESFADFSKKMTQWMGAE